MNIPCKTCFSLKKDFFLFFFEKEFCLTCLIFKFTDKLSLSNIQFTTSTTKIVDQSNLNLISTLSIVKFKNLSVGMKHAARNIWKLTCKLIFHFKCFSWFGFIITFFQNKNIIYKTQITLTIVGKLISIQYWRFLWFFMFIIIDKLMEIKKKLTKCAENMFIFSVVWNTEWNLEKTKRIKRELLCRVTVIWLDVDIICSNESACLCLFIIEWQKLTM